MNHYEILGVPRDADGDSIGRAYRRLVRQHHPDLSGDADAAAFRTVQDAYEVLSDPAHRAAYDLALSDRVVVNVIERPVAAARPPVRDSGGAAAGPRVIVHPPGWKPGMATAARPAREAGAPLDAPVEDVLLMMLLCLRRRGF